MDFKVGSGLSGPKRNKAAQWTHIVFFASLMSFVGYVLWLPVFPTGDGPMHIYYSSIFGDLASHIPTVYSDYYAIRHLIQPYSLHYLLVSGLGRFVPAVLAEKLFVILILIVNALGFRCLARQLGPEYSTASLLIFPLLFGWALSAGFLNFCFATGASFFALAFWFSLSSGKQGQSPRRTLLYFLLSLGAIVFSHPAPQMVLIVMASGDLLLMWFANRRAPIHKNPRSLCWNCVALAMACMSFIAPMILADKSRVESVWRDIHPHRALVHEFILGNRLDPFAGTTGPAILYRILIVSLLPAVLLFQYKGLRQQFSVRRFSPSDRLLFLALIYSILVISFPGSMNGGSYFADRMWTITWPLMLATVAGASLSMVMRRAVISFASVGIVLALWLAIHTLTPIAHRQYLLAEAPLPEGRSGILLEPPSSNVGWINGTNFALYSWAGARPFAQHHDVILNSPWLEFTWLPVKEKKGAELIVNSMPLLDSEMASQLYMDMSSNIVARQTALAQTDFILFADPSSRAPDPLTEIETLLSDDARDWVCTNEGFYAVCRRKGRK